jgi:hypothetical protein
MVEFLIDPFLADFEPHIVESPLKKWSTETLYSLDACVIWQSQSGAKTLGEANREVARERRRRMEETGRGPSK